MRGETDRDNINPSNPYEMSIRSLPIMSKIIVERFYVDLDDVPLKRIKCDVFRIFERYPNSMVELFASGSEGHYTLVVSHVKTTLKDSIECLMATHCSLDYINLVMIRKAYFLRISAKYDMKYDGNGHINSVIVTDKPELLARFKKGGYGEDFPIVTCWFNKIISKRDKWFTEVIEW